MIKNTLLLFSFLILSCTDGNIDRDIMSEKVYAESAEVIEDIVEYKDKQSTPTNVTSTLKQKQKLIKTSYLTFETTSVEDTYQSVKRRVASYNGYIQNDNTSKEYNRINRSLLIRIPNQNFQSLVDSITVSVKSLDRKDIQLKDVTEEFIDLEARLKAKHKLEERYLQLLAKANSVKDMLEIERQIAQIREEIEVKQGRLNYLQNKVSFSTIHLSFYELTREIKAPSQTYSNRLWRAVKGGFKGIGEFIIGVVYLWPFILIAVLIGFFIRYRIQKNK
jgi:hypothetical protein